MRVITLLLTLIGAARAAAQAADSVDELKLLGRARISAVYDLEAAPPYAYALERENLRVLDVRDPRAVREVANLEFTGPRLWSFIHGSGLYLAGFGQPLAVVDVSQPLLPRWLGPVQDVPHPMGVQIVGDHLYVVEGGPELSLGIMQLRDTAGIPDRLGTLNLAPQPSQRFSGIDYDSGRLYVLLERPRSSGSQLAVIDVEQPSQPRHERRIALPKLWDYRKVAVRGDLAYVTMADAEGAFGLATLRLGDGQASLLGSITDPRIERGGRMIVNGQAIYATYKHSAILATFDVSDPHAPKLAQAFEPLDSTASGLGFSRSGDRLYVSGDAGASTIFDISSPLAPRCIGAWSYNGGWARAIALEGYRAVVLNWTHGLLIYDIEDPSSPRLLGSFLSAQGDEADHLARNGDLVLLSHGAREAEVVDISDPASPTVVSRFPVAGTVVAGALAFPWAIQAWQEGGLAIVDVTRPDTALVSLELEGAATDLMIRGRLVLVAHADGGVSSIDMTRPLTPNLVGRAMVPAPDDDRPEEMLTRIALSHDGLRAFTLRGEKELEDGTVTVSVFDVEPKTGARHLSSLEVSFSGWAQDYAILGGKDEVLVGAGSSVFLVGVDHDSGPAIRKHYHLPDPVEGLARQGQLIAVAASEDGMQLFQLPSQ